MPSKIEELRVRLAEITNLRRAAAVLGWDQQCFLPPGGGAARAEQLATLSRIAHERFTDSSVGDLLSAAEEEAGALDYDSDDAAILRITRRDYDRATKRPADFVAEFARLKSTAHQIWEKARAEDDFPAYEPTLEKIFEMCRQDADYQGYDDRPYDALLDEYEPGMKTADTEKIFSQLRAELVPLLQRVLAATDGRDDAVLRQPFDVRLQREFGEAVIRDFGYDFDRGRQDEAAHPFTTGFSVNDVRITTRFNPDWLAPALFGTLHEAGHAIYEQGVDEALDGTIVGRGASLGVHESQSRLWENIVGRSLGFWRHYYPKLQQLFPEQLGDVALSEYYRAINLVSPTLIRVEADELTYNLHVMLRFELENAVLDGELAVADLPAAWGDRMEEYLGVRPPNDVLGVLQDVHWSGGMVGYFPTYSFGNLLSAQLYDKAVADVPGIPDDIEQGRFDSLLGWMRDNVHRHGRKYTPTELVGRATGEPLQSRSYMHYLHEKYGSLYSL